MPSDLNAVRIMGRLGADPEVRTFESGDKVANLRIATSDRWKDKNTGEDKEKTEWHSVAVLGPLAKVAEQYLRKGARVYVEGKLRTRKWQAQDGTDRWTTEVVVQGFADRLDVIDWPERDGGGREQGQRDSYGDLPGPGRQDDSGYGAGGRPGGRNDMDDEIPFAPEVRA